MDRPPSDPAPHTDAALLARFTPYLQYDSLESFRADSAATLPELFFDDGSKWSYTNTLKQDGGKVLAAARPGHGEPQLDLAFLGRRYPGGVAAKRSDFLDEAGRRYVEDARRLHAEPRYADRIYGHAVRDAAGNTWLQYYFFYYYNDKSFLGIGLHEGDWEMIQLRLGADGVPDAATFAQHDTGQALAWSEVELRNSPDGKVPVVYVGRGSHASFPTKGEHWPLLPLPQPDYADGKGPRIRPALDLISDSGPSWALWPGKWGSSDASPRGPSTKKQWHQPAAFHQDVSDRVTLEEVAAPLPPAPPAPKLEVRRLEDQFVVTYSFPRIREGTARPERLVLSVDKPDDDLPPSSYGYTVRAPTGVIAHPARVGKGPYVIRGVAYSEDGVQSRVVSVEA
jgi:Vacuolar protein sorting-associated protein 62